MAIRDPNHFDQVLLYKVDDELCRRAGVVAARLRAGARAVRARELVERELAVGVTTKASWVGPHERERRCELAREDLQNLGLQHLPHLKFIKKSDKRSAVRSANSRNI